MSLWSNPEAVCRVFGCNWRAQYNSRADADRYRAAHEEWVHGMEAGK